MIAPWLILVAALGGAVLALRGRGMIRHPDGSMEEWDDRGPSHDLVKWGGISLMTCGLGAAAFIGLGVGTGSTSGGRSSPAASYTAPNAPLSVSTGIVDTSTIYAIGSTFVGSLDDTQDSIRYAITRLAADTTAILTEVKTGAAQIRDTIADNTNLKADTTYKSWLKYHGVNGGWSAWSAPDTFINRVITVAFWCDYRNATIGTTSAAGLSTCAAAGDWNGTYVGAGNLNGIIIDSTGYTAKGWPTAKIFRIRSQLSAGASEPVVRGLTAPWTTWDTVAVGDSTHFRAYVLMEVPDSVPTSQGHPIEARTGNTWPWGLRFRTEEDSTKWGLAIVGAQGQGANQKIWDLVSLNRMILPKDTTIRLEWQVKRTYVDSIQLHMRIYVWNGSTFALRYSDSDFDRRSATGTLADNVNVIKLAADSLNTLVGGSNGFDFGSTYQVNYTLQGAFAVCNVWCGEYPIASVEN